MTGGSRVTLEQAYGYCREVARREAKNFYAAFRVLPKAKSDAMCAVYAFMRQADDLSDDEGLTLEARRLAMAAWLEGWRASRGGFQQGVWEDGADPVFVALADTQARFGVTDALLDDLVRGTNLDLEEWPPGVSSIALTTMSETATTRREVQVYETFGDLYRYCYLVASVVGLVCIRIFGYTDPAAELLAEKTGVAFQLTNILRDVKEDAERGRIYLPQEMLEEFGVRAEDVLGLAGGRGMKENERALMHALSVQAWEYYEAAGKLLPLIESDSRAALWVLVEVYSRLLRRVDRAEGDVFSRRASVPGVEKASVLVRGAAMAVRGRLGRLGGLG